MSCILQSAFSNSLSLLAFQALCQRSGCFFLLRALLSHHSAFPQARLFPKTLTVRLPFSSFSCLFFLFSFAFFLLFLSCFLLFLLSSALFFLCFFFNILFHCFFLGFLCFFFLFFFIFLGFFLCCF